MTTKMITTNRITITTQNFSNTLFLPTHLRNNVGQQIDKFYKLNLKMRFHNYRHVKFSFGCQQNMHVIDFKLKVPATRLKITLFVIVKSLIF